MAEDILLATEWAYLNVRRLGGDPDNITLAGQSAGAHICMCLLVNTFIASKTIETHACYSEEDNAIISTAVAVKPMTPYRLQDDMIDSAVVVDEAQTSCSDDEDNSDCLDSSIWREVSDCSIDRLNIPPSFSNMHHKSTSTDPRYFSPLHTSHSINSSNNNHYTTTNDLINNDNNGPLRPFDLLRCVKRFIGVSGPYNLGALENHFQQRGLDGFILRWICKGDVSRYSPTEALREFIVAHQQQQQQPSQRQRSFSNNSLSIALSDFPEVSLFHGSCDATIPSSISRELQTVLVDGGCKNVSLHIYEGWSHTDAILEAPMVGDNRLFRDMSDILHGESDSEIRERNQEIIELRDEALISNTLANFARYVNPF